MSNVNLKGNTHSLVILCANGARNGGEDQLWGKKKIVLSHIHSHGMPFMSILNK